MAEEEKKDVVPAAQPGEKVEVKKEEPVEEVVFDNVKNPNIPVRTIEDICIEELKHLNGYPYIGVSRPMTFNENAKTYKEMSWLVQHLLDCYILTGRGNQEEFKKAFIGSPIVHLYAFERMPTLADDGCYNPIDVFGKGMKSVHIREYPLIKADNFKPFIVIKQRDPETGVISFGKIVGDPYHNVTTDEAQAVKEALQGEENKSPSEQAQ